MFIMIPSLLVYAWTAHFKTNAAGPLIALFFNGFSIMSVLAASPCLKINLLILLQGDILVDLGLPRGCESWTKFVRCKLRNSCHMRGDPLTYPDLDFRWRAIHCLEVLSPALAVKYPYPSESVSRNVIWNTITA